MLYLTLPCVCSVIDHRWRQNVVRTKKWHTRRSTATWNLFVLYNKELNIRENKVLMMTSSIRLSSNRSCENQSECEHNWTYYINSHRARSLNQWQRALYTNFIIKPIYAFAICQSEKRYFVEFLSSFSYYCFFTPRLTGDTWRPVLLG